MIVGDVEVVVLTARRTRIDLGRDLKMGVASGEEPRAGSLKETHWSSSPNNLVKGLYGVLVAHTSPCTALLAVDTTGWPRSDSEGYVGIVNQWL